MTDEQAYRQGIELLIKDLRKAQRLPLNKDYMLLILGQYCDLLNKLGKGIGLCAPVALWSESKSTHWVCMRDPRTGEGGLAMEIGDEDLVENLINNIEKWVLVKPSRHPPANHKRVDPAYRSARWFSNATGRHLTADALRKAAKRKKITCIQKEGGMPYLYSLKSVMSNWPEFIPVIAKQLKRESSREPVQRRARSG